MLLFSSAFVEMEISKVSTLDLGGYQERCRIIMSVNEKVRDLYDGIPLQGSEYSNVERGTWHGEVAAFARLPVSFSRPLFSHQVLLPLPSFLCLFSFYCNCSSLNTALLFIFLVSPAKVA